MASEYRLKRGPVLVLLLVVGAVGAVVLARGSVRPALDVYAPTTVPAAYAGTTYAVDGLVCVRASSVGARLTGTTGTDRAGVRTQLGARPADAAPSVAFPVAADALAPVADLEIAAGDQSCLRVLVSADNQGEQPAGEVGVRARYGPFGLLRTTLSVSPPVLLQVAGTGRDPRAG